MWPFRRFNPEDRFEKRLREVEEGLAEVRRIARNCDVDVSSAIEKMNRLAGRLAKRVEAGTPPYPSHAQGGQPGPSTDPISARILERRSRGRSLAEEASDGVLPER
jgi:hypothetical protein